MKSVHIIQHRHIELCGVGGCANVPSESIDKSVTTPQSTAQEIGTSEPEKEQHPVLLNEMSGTESDGIAAPAAIEESTLRNKSEKTGDDMERLD